MTDAIYRTSPETLARLCKAADLVNSFQDISGYVRKTFVYQHCKIVLKQVVIYHTMRYEKFLPTQ